MVNKKALVIGASGFIGSNLVRSLLKSGYQTHIIVKSSSNLWRLTEVLNKTKVHTTDLFDLEQTKQALRSLSPHVVFNLAAHGSYPKQNDVSAMIETNIRLIYNLLVATEDIPLQSFVNTGSSSEYGFKKEAMTEDMLLEPTSFYAATKAGGTLLAQSWAKVKNKPVVTVRPFSVYGPWEEPGRFIPTVITRLLKGAEINLTSDQEVRDFIYVDDFVESLIQAATLGEKVSGEIINSGSGTQTKLTEIVDTLFKISGKTVKVNLGAYKPRDWDTNFWVSDTAKAHRLLNWTPVYTVEKGLKECLKWFEAHMDYYNE